MFDTWHDKEFLLGIINAIHENAAVRPYDEWILGVGIAGILASIAVAYFAYQLNKKQIEIAKTQSDISAEQTEIAKKQTDIMEQQNNISLFDKRYELFKIMEQIEINVMVLFKVNFRDDIFNKFDELYRRYHVIGTLFRGTIQAEYCYEFSKVNLTNDELKVLERNSHDMIINLQKIEFLFVLTKREVEKFNDILNSMAGMLMYFSSLPDDLKKETTLSLEGIFYNNLERLKKITEFNIILKKQLYLVNKQSTQASKPCKTTE